MQIEQVAISSLVLDPANARKHEAKDLDVIKGSLARFGQQKPIVVKGNIVRAGNGTLEAARQLGWDKISVVRTELEGNELSAYALVDNRSAELSTWDDEILAASVKALSDAGIPMPDLGFADFDFSVPPEPQCDEDEVPEHVEPRTRKGDLYVLGAHRLLCGDSINVLDVERLMGGEKASVWLSDPPYGINHVETSQEKGQSKGYNKIANDDLQDDDLKDFIFSVISASLPHMKERFAFYMWHAMKMQGYAAAAAAAAAAAGILFHRQIIWVKPQLVFGRGHYHWRHELCLMGWLQGNEPPFYGERNQTTVWECSRENDKIHPTQKPIGLLEPSITNHTKSAAVVYDPFLGSGSTLIACEKTGRRCFGMEIDPHYCDVIVSRWEKYTGKTASLLQGEDTGDGQATSA